ncbi:pyridoxal-phosphate-dependent aminotransferase family protein [Anaerosphaera multitolerans]|uniref:Alanine--glyoxylate aminotransferase family protein n=1 Tax=Anaerosphaera multitolerans TaxID=2487351 RepID=A0A437S4V1_9FIRM|nr:alanine--glyoxylate aminotransferase family protein [Anaerosphaera multitolerans]RVU54039.1 alanine--glyoxylate aminotransferase family protein [Anaerosphaera multitolerans]
MKLFIPGPTYVREDVLMEMTKPLIGHRTKDASALQKGITEKMKQVFITENMVLSSTSSGCGLMEGAIRSCTSSKGAVFSMGSFGDKWHKIGLSNGLDVDLFKVEHGNTIDANFVDEVLRKEDYDFVAITHNETSTGVKSPLDEIAEVMKNYEDIVWAVDAVSSAAGSKIETDKLGIDIVITSTQKCLALPPGMAFCTFSEKAIERAKTVENRGNYFDLLSLYKDILKRDYQYPNTPNISLMYAADYQLNHIVNEEGLENRFNRHKEMAEYVRNWAMENFALFPKDIKDASDTVTCVENNRGIDVGELNKELAKRGMIISNGYGDLKNKTFRIAHMGDLTMDDIKELLENIDEIIK